jgi:hypothetical protein
MPQAVALQAIFNASQQSTLELVDHAVIAGGDPITTGALAAARVLDNSTPAVYSDLLIAQDYERYRANAEAINTLMAVNPDSDFTAGSAEMNKRPPRVNSLRSRRTRHARGRLPARFVRQHNSRTFAYPSRKSA